MTTIHLHFQKHSIRKIREGSLAGFWILRCPNGPPIVCRSWDFLILLVIAACPTHQARVLDRTMWEPICDES